MTLRLGAPRGKYHPTKFGGHRHFGNGDNGFSLSRDLAKSRDQRVM